MYIIEPASADKQERIASFVKRMLTSLYPEGSYDPDPADLAAFEETYIVPPNACFFIAVNEHGDIVGTGAVRPYNERFPFLREGLAEGPTCELVRFYIDENYRRIGLGAALFAKSETFAKSIGYTQGYLHTSVYLPGGYPFWLSRGYEELHWETDQVVHMRKRLS